MYVNKNIVGRSPFSTYKCWLINFAVYAVLVWVNRYIVIVLDTYMKIFLFCVPYTVIVFILYFTVISISEPQSFKFVYEIIGKITKKLFAKLKKIMRGDLNGKTFN